MLGEIRDDLIKETGLHSVGLVEFCMVMMKCIGRYWPNNSLDEGLIGMLCQIFDCVDVDSRGIIDFEDFVSFALRSGRNRFKPVSGYSNIEYSQRLDIPDNVPVRQLFFCEDLQTLFAFDGDLPVVRIFKKNGDLAGNFNPIEGILRLMKVRSLGKQPYYAKKKAAKLNAVKRSKVAKKPSAQKGTVTAMAYIERKHQLVISTSDCFISFWNSRLQHLVDFVQAEIPQMGMTYCSEADVLLSWGGDSEDHDYRVWDVNARKLKFKFNLHSRTILTTIEIRGLSSIVSSSIDRTLLLWPTAKLLKHGLPDYNEVQKDLAETYLLGHTHAIRSVAYAPDNDMILGAGFDYDIYGWDTTTRTLQLKMIGHRHSVVAVAIIYNPHERAASVDEVGTVKVWNLDRAQGMRAQHLQSIAIGGRLKVFAFTPTINHGATLAVLAEQLYFFDLQGGILEDNRCISGGMIVCEQTSRLWVIARKLTFETDLSTGRPGKVFEIISEERMDTCATGRIVTKSKALAVAQVCSKAQKKASSSSSVMSESFANGTSKINNFDARDIYTDDDTTAATGDLRGKKIFTGTQSGLVLMYDATTVGILTQLSYEEHTTGRENTGAVVRLRYCERSEILVAAYAAGAVKVFSGCHRTISSDKKSLYVDSSDICDEWCPYFQGGGTPPAPQLLRVNYLVHETTVIAMDVSEEFGLIAVSGADGTVRVLDFYTLLIRSVYAAPYIERQPVECTHLCFVPSAPLLLGADSQGRLTLWSVYPLKPVWVYTWSLSQGVRLFSYTSMSPGPGSPGGGTGAGGTRSPTKDLDNISDAGIEEENKDGDYADTVDYRAVDEDMLEDESGVGVTSLQCVVWQNSEYQNYSEKKAERVEWTCIVGDSVGRITLLDITDLVSRVEAADFKALLQAAYLHRHSLPYQQWRRKDIKDGLEEFQISEVLSAIRHPIGMLGQSNDSQSDQCIGGQAVGHKGVSIKDIKRRLRWTAHVHGVSEIRALQKLNLMSTPLGVNRRSIPTLAPSIGNKPYALISVSEYGTPKRWSWRGVSLDDETADGILFPDASEDFKSLLTRMEESKTGDSAEKYSMYQVPSGAAQERISAIVNWVLPVLSKAARREMMTVLRAPKYDKHARKLEKSMSEITQYGPIVDAVQEARESSKRRQSMSEILWKNSRENQVAPPLDEEDDKDDFLSHSYVSTGFEEGQKDTHDLNITEKDLTVLKQQAAAAGIKGSQVDEFVMGIAAMKAGVDIIKQRQEAQHESWNSKVRFPNLMLEGKRKQKFNNKKTQEVAITISSSKQLETANTDPRGYEEFVKKREKMYSTIDKGLQKAGTISKSELGKVDDIITDDEQPEICQATRRRTVMTAIRSPPDRFMVSNKQQALHVPAAVLTGPTLVRQTSADNEDITIDDSLAIQSGGDDAWRSCVGPNKLNREKKEFTRQESMSRIQETMMRFEYLTNSDDKKYMYSWTQRKSESVRRKRAKSKDLQKGGSTDHKEIGNMQAEFFKPDLQTGRYGPYKTKDIVAFEEFISRLPMKHSTLDPDVTEQALGDYFADIMITLSMGSVYDHREVINIAEQTKSKMLARTMMSLRDRSDGTILRNDIFNAIFTFASDAEKLRIYTFGLVRAVLFEVLRNLQPMQSTIPSFDELQMSYFEKMAHPNATPKHGRKSAIVGLSSPVTGHPITNSGTVSPPGLRQTRTPKRKNSGIEGWKLEKSMLEDLKKMFDDLYNDINGTVIGSEVIDIVQSSPVIQGLEKPLNISFLALRRGFPLHLEVNGASIGSFFEDILKVEIAESHDVFLERGIQSRDPTPLASPRDVGTASSGVRKIVRCQPSISSVLEDRDRNDRVPTKTDMGL